MGNAREHFLDTVRRAVAEGNRAGQVPGHPDRGGVGYQGGGPDPLRRFAEECRAAGGQVHVVPDPAAAVARILALLNAAGARRVVLDRSTVLDSLNLAEALRSAGMEAAAGTDRDTYFQADVGVTGVDYLIAETGSLALFTRPDQPRSASLLPPVHVAVARRDQLLPDLFDQFNVQGASAMPACVTLITGPSKTGDIELKLVTGVHGPGEVHVVVMDEKS